MGLFFFGFTGCKTTEKTGGKKQSKNATAVTTVLKGREKVAFDETFFAGLSAKYAGDSKSAMAYFQQCLSLDPNNNAVKYELSQVYIKVNYFENAIQIAEEVVASEPNNRWYVENLAGTYKFASQYDKCAQTFQTLVDQYPKEIMYYYELGSAYLYANQIPEAINTYEAIQANFGYNSDISEQLVKLYLDQKQTEKAEQELLLLVDANPGNIKYVTQLANFYKSQGNTAKAIALYEDLKKANPDDPYVKLALYEYYVANNQQEEAFKNLEEAFESSKVEWNAKMSMLITLIDQSANSEVLKAEVLELFEILTKSHPNNAQVWAIYGEYLSNQNQKEKAREAILKSLEFDQGTYQVWNQLLFLDSDLNDGKALLAHSQDCMELFPNQVFPYFFSGLVYLQESNFEQAIKYLEGAKDRSPGIRDLDIQIYTSLGDAYYQEKNYQKAWLSYESALRMDPNNVYVLNNYAYFLSVNKQDLDKALEMSKKTVDAHPQNAVYLDTYGWIYYQLKDYTNSVKYLKLAVQFDTEKSGEICEHLGDAYFKLGDETNAILNWKLAKEYGSGSEFLIQKIKDKKVIE